MRLQPFAALRPRPELAARVASVPYDVVNRAEAAELAAGNELSFLHVVRAEIDLPADCNPYDDRVYAQARANLAALQAKDVLRRDAQPALYLYRLTMDGRTQTGLVGCVHIDDYEHDLIKKHEKTRPDKEDDRTRHILTLEADAEPVILTYRDHAGVDTEVSRAVAGGPAEIDFTAADGVRHEVWCCDAPTTQRIATAFGAVPCSYVADGHHRCASAWRAGVQLRQQSRQSAPQADTAGREFNWFPAVLFPSSQLRIMPYNRLVRCQPGQTEDDVRQALAAVGELVAGGAPTPPAPGSFAFRIGSTWHLLRLDPASIDADDPIRSLDVDLLQRRVLEPIFGIGDPRTDQRIEFIGGIRGTAELERRVAGEPESVGVSMYPTAIAQLLGVADAGEVMPPKSTWFEPKLRSGLFVHVLD